MQALSCLMVSYIGSCVETFGCVTRKLVGVQRL
jgi:hypothetical protein